MKLKCESSCRNLIQFAGLQIEEKEDGVRSHRKNYNSDLDFFHSNADSEHFNLSERSFYTPIARGLKSVVMLLYSLKPRKKDLRIWKPKFSTLKKILYNIWKNTRMLLQGFPD